MTGRCFGAILTGISYAEIKGSDASMGHNQFSTVHIQEQNSIESDPGQAYF